MMLVFPKDKAREQGVHWADDVSLAKAASKGDPVAQKQLVSSVLTSIRKTLAYISSNPSDVDDLTQLAIIQVLKSARNYRGESALTYWADRIAIRTAAKQFEKRHRREGLFARFFGSENQVPNLEEQIDRNQVREQLAVLLSPLYYKNRNALILRYVKGYSIDEIAELMDCKRNTARGFLRRGKKQLEKAILTDPILSSWLERSAK